MPIAFTAAGTLGGVTGANLNNPTSLQFGPDGRLYVSEQNGSVNAYTVEKQGDTWVMTGGEQLEDANGNELVKNIQNHNDDGSEASTGNRQVTGIAVAGTEDEPVLYISSSDPRISSNNDTGLDTNSGTVTRASFNNTTGEWEVIDLVRGLPRSEENHSVNGMLLSEDGTKLLLNVGGHTNNGAASGFFSYTNEYALSGATLELDLVALDALPTLTDPEGGQNNTPRDYKYDLPTLDDPNIENVTDGVGEDEFGMDENGPHGGNDGLNMAILPADAPLRLYAEGTRNDYDLARGENGLIYTVDNGSNGGLGGVPNTESGDDDGDGVSGEAIATPNNGGPGEGEPFHQLVEGGYYYHPNPVRSNQNMEWTVYNNSGNPDTSLSVNTVSDISDLVPDAVNIADGFLIDPSKHAVAPGQTLADLTLAEQAERLLLSGTFINSNDLDGNPDPDGSGSGQPTIAQLGSSTNGIIVYDSGGTAFAGTIDGAVFVTQFNDNLTLLNVNDAGTDLEPVLEEGPDGIFGTADDVVQDADGILQVANNGLGVPLGNPLDVTQGPNGTLWVAEIGSNEITVLEPTNVLDPTNEDADFDGILNAVDPFSRDATNGTSVTITAAAPTVWEFSQDAGDVTPGPDGFGGGLTGAMINGITDFEAFYLEEDPDNAPDLRLDNVKFVTAAGGGTTTIEEVSNGDPFEDGNDGEYLFHTGFVLDQAVDTFTTTWVVANPGAVAGGPDITSPFQQIGGYLGDGTQSNYLKIVALQQNGGPVIQIALEEAVSQGGFPETFQDQVLQTIELPAPGIFDNGTLVPDSAITLELVVDLTAKTATPTATYQTTTGEVTVTGGPGDVIDLVAPGGTDSAVLQTFLGGAALPAGEEQGIAAGLFSSNNGSTSDTFQAVFDSITVSATEAEVAPVAVDDEVTTQIDTAIAIPVADLLANDTDVNSDEVLTITGVGNASSGSVALNGGVVTYTPDTGFEGDATFDYTVEDSTGLTDTGSVTVSVSDLTVLFRLNAGGGTIAALPNDPYGSDLDWEGLGTGSGTAPSGTQSGLDWSVTSTNTSGHTVNGRDASVPDYVPQEIYQVERWDPPAGSDMQWSFGGGDLQNGTYTVNIFAANGFTGTSEPGQRVFDITIEDELAFNNVDLADQFGSQVAGFFSYEVQVDDGTLNVELGRDGTDSVENPTINGIEILQGAVTPQVPTIDILGGDQTVGEDAGTAFISIATSETVTASGGLNFTYVIEGVSATPQIDYEPDESLSGSGTATFTGNATIAPSSSDFQIPIDILQDTDIEPNETFTVTITSVGPGFEIGNGTATITIEDDDTVTQPGEVVVRINAGGPEVAANDGGIAWEADESAVVANNNAQLGTPSSFLRDGSDLSTYGDNTPEGPGVNATGAPDALFTTERFWEPAGEYGYDFDLANGDYTVNLYFDELFFTAAGDRIFDVEIEDGLVLDDYDPYVAAGGSNNTTVESFDVTLTDGELNIDFIKGSANNPNIGAIEIIAAADPTDPAILSIAAPTPASVVEGGNTGVTTLEFPVTFDVAPAEDVTVSYDVDINGTVTGGTLALGTADGVISVDVPNDDLANGDESVTVTLTGITAGDAAADLGTSVQASATVTEDDVAGGTAIYRINSGGAAVTATDGGIDWSADTGNNPTEFLVAGGPNTFAFNVAAILYDANAVNGAPEAIFQNERWDPPTGDEMQYEFTVDEGTYTINLYMVEGSQAESNPGARIFDVAVEGTVPAAFDEIEPYVLGGSGNGNTGAASENGVFVLSHTAEITDGTLDLDFLHATIQNPAIRGIEILAVDDVPYVPPLDDLFGTAVELSNSGLAPTDAGTLSDGDNIMSATQEGEGDGANGVRDRDYFTVEIPQGKILTGIFLDAYDVTNATAPDGFFAFQEGPQVTTDPLTGANVDDLTGAIIYGDNDLNTNLLDTMRGGFNDAATGTTLPAFDQELTGELTFWLNQGAGPNTPTLRFVVDDAPTPPAADVYLPNANGDFVFEAESAEDAAPGNWVFNQTSDLPSGHDVPSGDAYVLATSNHLGNAGGEELVYKFQPTESGFIQINLVAAFTGGSSTDENDSFTGVFLDGAALTPLPQQGEALAETEGNAIGDQGFYKTYSSGGNELDFILANKTWDNNGVPIIYQVTAGETYEFILKERSSGHKVDKIALLFTETEPSGVPGNNQAGTFQNFPVSPQTAPGAVISGRAFADGNDNAIDDGEPGIEGVTVELLDGTGSVIDTTTTLADGSYSFDNLPDGTYSVRFPTALATDPLVAADQGGNDAVDSDANQTTGETAQVAVVAGDVETDIDAGYDREVTLVGSAVLTVNDGANGIETSNFGENSFQITNTGQKQISAIEIDVTDALFPDAVFDPFDLAGDTTGKHLVIDSEGGTGVVIPLGGTNFDNPALEGITYFGAGGSAGYEKIRIQFNDFQPGETLGFSIDMDPNSIAGALKSTLDSGAPLAGAGNWDVGGIAGGELIGSSFSVEFDDASTSTGKLQGQGTGSQMGASALSTQAPAGLDVALTVNGLSEGAEGTYGDGGPQILIQGPDGETARVLVSKGFIVPFTNEFPDTDPYAATLDAQIAALEASGFPANNAVEMLYVDVALNGNVQDISGSFDFTQVAGFDLSVPDANNEYGILDEGKLPLGIVASVIDPASDLPKGNVTSPIHLQHSDNVADIALTPVNAELVESGDTGTSTLIEVNAQVQTGAEGTFEAVLTVNGVETATQAVTLGAGTNPFSFQVPNDNVDDGTDIATVTLRETGGGAPVPSTPAVFSITEDDGPVVGATLLRINAFGPELVASDSGPNWLADTEAAPISYFSSGDGSANFNRGDVIAAGDLSLDPDLPASTPSELFELTRSSNGPILYSIPVTDIPAASGEYQVNLYFAEGFFGPGGRVFDVLMEGALQTELDNVDSAALFGTDTGGAVSTTVEVTDGELNIEFLTGALSGAGGVQNPIISGIEIIELVDAVDPEADLSLEQTVSDINPDFGDTITFTLTVTNDGPDEATGVDVENLLPSGFGFVTSTASTGSYDDSTGLWDVGTLASGASATLTVDVTVLEASPTPDEVLFRVNAGGPLITATDGPDWTADTSAANSDYLVNAGSNNNNGFAVTPGATVPTSVPANIFDTERWDNTTDAAGEMQWEFPVAAGFYDVRLFMGNGFGGTSDPGQRVFDVQIEGATPTNLDDLDLSAVYGHQVGAMVSNIVEVTDGTLDIDFIHDIAENPLVNGIEIIKLGDAGPALDYANYAEVLASDQSDPDSTPGDGSTGDDDDTTLTVSPVAGGLNSVTIVANDAAAAEGTPTDPGQFTVELEEAAATETTVTYSVSGAATDGVDYQSLTGTVSIAAGDLSAPIDLTVIDDLEIEGDEDVVITLTDVSGDANLALGTPVGATAVIADDDVANEVAITVAQDASEPDVNGAFTVALAQAATTATEIAYTVTGSATSGSDFEPLSGTVTIAAGDLSAPIDVTVLDDGVAEGAEDIVVTLDAITSGDANIQLGAQTEAVMTLDDDEVLPINGSATLEITPGGSLGSSTFGGTTAFQITNTGATSDAKITAVSLNLATGILPDMVFDPTGSGGDATAQVFSPNAGSASLTGLVPFADNAVDPFSQARNGGFDVISMEFTDFDPGETFSFSVDIDPNNIQGVSGAGNAGAVSGYELIGSTVTLTFDDGTTQEVATSSLYEDGSLGGAQSVSQTALTTGTVLAAPTITLDGPGVDASANLPGQQTYVAEGDVDQTVLVTGTPGATVSLLQMDARLYIASGDAPFDVQPDEAPFYANEAMSGKVVHSAVLDANGEAMIPVTLLETPSGDTTPDGGLNHFVAVLSDGAYAPGQPISQTSNTLVVTQAPTVDVSIAALVDGAEPATNGQFEVTLAQPSTVDTVVSYEVNASSTATPNADYTALSGTVTIPAGDTSATIDVSVLDDLEIEVDETVVVDLTEVTASNGLAVIGAQNSATVSITSDDVAASEADLSLTKTVSDATPTFGDTVTFDIEVVNGGPDAAGGITVADVMGDGFALAGATATVGTFDNVSGIWTLGSLAAGATATLTIDAQVLEASPTPDEVVYRINAGDNFTTGAAADEEVPSDGSSPNWAQDLDTNPLRTGGTDFGNEDGAPVINLMGLPAGTPAAVNHVFETERYGDQQWDFAVDNGDYTVNLYFAEIFIGQPGGGSDLGAGDREFDVEVEGALVLDDYDIFAEVGTGAAVLKSFDTTVTDDNLDIDLTTVTDNAKISAIEIIKTGDAGEPLDYSTSAEILNSDVADPDSTPGNGLVGEDDDASLTLTPSATGGNDAPVITSADSFEFVQGSAGPVFTATATDADLDPVAFALGTGGDEGFFAIDETTGQVTLTGSPDFVINGEIDTLAEVVQDLSITVEASDGTETTSQDITVQYLKDTDTDGIADRADNAIFVENPDQRDSDEDNYGNIIDADLDNDESIGFSDFVLFRDAFDLEEPVDPNDPTSGLDADFDGDGSVGFSDFVTFRDLFGEPLGTSYIDLDVA